MPIYESNKNREDEDLFAWQLEYMGFEVKQSGTTHRQDMLCLWDSKPYALIEYKHRSRHWNPLKVDVDKIDSLIDRADELEVKPIFAVSFDIPEGRSPYYLWTAHKDAEVDEAWAIQRARGDSPDRAYMIPWKEFSLL